MAQESPLSATGALTEAQYEALAAPQCPDGLIGWPGNMAIAAIFGGQIAIKAGNHGIVRGFPWAAGLVDTYHNPVLTGAARTDLVVLRLYRDQGYKVETAIRQGTPGAGVPVPFTSTGPTDWYEIPLATYEVASGTLSNLRTVAWYVGDDGQILCWSDRRPPNHPGRRIREVDTGRSYESNGTRWIVLLDDAGDLALPYVTATGAATGWSAGVNHLTRINGEGRLAISPQRTGANIANGAVVTLGTLPAGFRPRRAFEVPGYAISSGAHVVAFVNTNGVIDLKFWGAGLNKNSYCNLPPFTWPIAA